MDIQNAIEQVYKNGYEKGKKETAKEILEMYRLEDTFSSFQNKVMERYGVEVEE